MGLYYIYMHHEEPGEVALGTIFLGLGLQIQMGRVMGLSPKKGEILF